MKRRGSETVLFAIARSSHQQSYESISFREHSNRLQKAMNSGILSSLPRELFSRGLISQENVEECTNERNGEINRASNLVSQFVKLIETDRKNFEKILLCCEEYVELKPVLKDVRDKLFHENMLNLYEDVTRNKFGLLQEKSCSCSLPPVYLMVCAIVVLFLGVVIGIYISAINNHLPSNSTEVEVSIVTSPYTSTPPENELIGFDGMKFQLPSPPEPFVGRKFELNVITSDLLGPNVSIVGIFGPPAFGKSSLAVHVGHRLLKHLAVHYIDISEYGLSFQQKYPSDLNKRPTELRISKIPQKEVLKTHNLSEMKKALKSTHLTEWAEQLQGQTVLVLDNCDTLLNQWQDEFQSFVLNLMKVTFGKLKILMTSQKKIAFLDNFQAYEINELHPNESFSLMEHLSKNSPGEFHKTLAELVGNCPLAIKILVTLLNQPRTVSAATLVEKVEREPLGVLSDDKLPKRSRFTIVMDIACQYLGEELRQIAYQVCLFPGSFDEHAAASIVGHHLSVENLVDRSLLERFKTQYGFGVRYKLHRLIKEYFQSINLVNKPETFQDNFIKYYSHLFSDTIRHTHSNRTQTERILMLEQHNMEHLLHQIMNVFLYSTRSASFLGPAHASIVLFAYKEKILPENALLQFPVTLLKHIFQSDVLLEGACAILGHDECTSMFFDFSESLLGERTVIDPPFIESCDFVKRVDAVVTKQSRGREFHLLHAAVNRSKCYCLHKKQIMDVGKLAHVVTSIMFMLVFGYLNRIHFIDHPNATCINTTLAIGIFMFIFKTVLNYDKVWNGLLIPLVKLSPLNLLATEIIFFNFISFGSIFYYSTITKAAPYLFSLLLSGGCGLYIVVFMDKWVVKVWIDMAILILSFALMTMQLCIYVIKFPISKCHRKSFISLFIFIICCYCKLFQTISLFFFVNACSFLTKTFCTYITSGSYQYLIPHLVVGILIYFPFSVVYNVFPFWIFSFKNTLPVL